MLNTTTTRLPLLWASRSILTAGHSTWHMKETKWNTSSFNRGAVYQSCIVLTDVDLSRFLLKFSLEHVQGWALELLVRNVLRRGKLTYREDDTSREFNCELWEVRLESTSIQPVDHSKLSGQLCISELYDPPSRLQGSFSRSTLSWTLIKLNFLDLVQ